MSTRLLLATMIGIGGLATSAVGQGLCPSGSVGVVNPGDGPDVCVKWGEQFAPTHNK